MSACWLSIGAYAVIASPEPISVTQPDGSTLTLKITGDEFHHYYSTLDGTPMRRTAKGMWVADESVAQEPTSARKARRVAQERQLSSSYPLEGSPKSLVILVNFTDLKFQYTLADFERMLNESGYSQNGGVGSARDYFIASSDSVFSPVFDCYGPVTVSKGYAYYGGNSGSSSSIHASQMVVEACNLVADMGVDMAQYDTNNDGRLDNVFVYFAGHNEAEHGGENTIWPHRSAVGGSERVQGKLIYDYACTSELRGASGKSMCGIGTFCHEFGHVLGLPDYYDTGYKYYTVGTWDIMCSGSYNGNGKTPPSYTAGERFQLGWLTPIQLKDAGPYTLEPLETSNKAYLIAETEHNLSFNSADPNEYWLLENRQNVGWDAPSTALPGTGMLIFHITYNAGSWGANTPNCYLPLRYDIEEAYGAKGYSTPSDPFPGTAKVTQFTPILHNKTIVEQPILDIAEEGLDIVFTFKSANGENFMFLPTALPVIESTYNPDNRQAYTPASKVKLAGSSLEPGTAIASISGSGFTISTDSLTWSTSTEMTIGEDSTLEKYLYVRYAPRKQVCDIQLGRIYVRIGGGTVGTYTVHGTSPRPTLIKTPEVSAIEEVTPTSFKVRWNPETDAEYYYVTMYHMEEGTESTVESFENFDDENVVHEAGWHSSFFRTTTRAKEEGLMSMWFKQDGENMLSPRYNLSVTKLSMWLSAPATTDTEVGWIILSAINDTAGKIVLDTIKIGKNTKKYTYSRSFSETDHYTQFQIDYAAFGGEGVCLDAFTTTFNQRTVYTYKGRERTIDAQEGELAEKYAIVYAYDLKPETNYFVQLQCSEEKGCHEHLSDLSAPILIRTKEGEAFDSKHLTLDFDSISYDPATHVIYLPQSLTNGSLCIYSAEGELVKIIPVGATTNIVPLPDTELRRGEVYLIKYLPNDRMKRKSPWIKILLR